jgi:Putative 8-oxoguanine DNA glycosylase OGG-like protein
VGVVAVTRAVTRVPELLRWARDEWEESGRPEPSGLRWTRAIWTHRLPDYAAYLAGIPDKIDRAVVVRRFASAERDEVTCKEAFVTAMLWGHGLHAYGAYRTNRVLDDMAAGPTLLGALRKVRAEGGPAGFDYLATHRLKGLGVSPGTKFLFFARSGHDGVPAAPILDRVVRRWLGQNIEWWPQTDWWSQDYARVCDLVTGWASELGVRPDTVVQLMSEND